MVSPGIGFGGVRDYDGQLSFTPALPHSWKQLAFSLRFRGRQIRIQLSQDEEQYLLDEGDPLKVIIRGEPHLAHPRHRHRGQGLTAVTQRTGTGDAGTLRL